MKLADARMGYALAVIVLICDVSALNNASMEMFVLGGLVYFSANIYWLFALHRVHRVLRELTLGSYKIRPGLAVIGQILPFYNVYWTFHWPNCLADFVRQRHPGISIPKGLIGMIILAGYTIAYFFERSLGIGILFGVMQYLNNKVSIIRRDNETTFGTNFSNHQEQESVSSCPQCGTIWEPKYQFCPDCGQQIGTPASHGIPSAGAEQRTGEKSCTGPSAQDRYYADILELQDKVRKQDIRDAYERLRAKYHQENLTHVGEELQALAEEKSREIEEAYEFFQSKYQL